jgi:hypothetical protein
MGVVVFQRCGVRQTVWKRAPEDHLMRHQHFVMEQRLQKLVARSPGAEGNHEDLRALHVRWKLFVVCSVQGDQALKKN